ncbi:MAG TPA: cytidylate kinase-like family protein [Candidatus Dormibacteraeota bacterium]|nr:cytidylate kinase-like family protein [Candidatus Dormibacteraeota bacterium]
MVVALARQFGSGSNRVAASVARELGYELVADQLPEAVAIRLETSPEEVRGREVSARSFGERLLRSLQAGTPEVSTSMVTADDAVVIEIQRLVREYADRGNCVIVGHGSTAILRGRSDVLTVLVRASLEWRARRIAQWWKVGYEVARAETERVDRAREAYIDECYHVSQSDAGLYHLVVDTEALGFEAASAAIVAAVRAKSSA